MDPKWDTDGGIKRFNNLVHGLSNKEDTGEKRQKSKYKRKGRIVRGMKVK